MKTLVVIDDEPAITEVLRQVLEDEGYRVAVANNGQAGLRLIQEEQPDLVLSDVMMPGLGGIELARRVQRDPCLKGTPVILMSAGRGPGSDLEGLCRAFVRKPFSIDAVVGVVSQQITGARSGNGR
jgi:CheY-like chemotaxis protein